MQPYSDREPSVEEQVTTEPQRLALEAMSNELVEKLHAMVEEQQQRAREFAAHQHSLSSLPSTHTPAVAPPPPPLLLISLRNMIIPRRRRSTPIFPPFPSVRRLRELRIRSSPLPIMPPSLVNRPRCSRKILRVTSARVQSSSF